MAMTVLIGFADALAAIEAAWSLRDNGCDVVAFARRGSRPALSRCRGVRIVEITAPERDTAAARADLAAVWASLRPVAALPLCDQSVWLCDRVHATYNVWEDQLRTALPGGAQARRRSFPWPVPQASRHGRPLTSSGSLNWLKKAGFAVPPWTHVDVDNAANHGLPFRGPGEPPWFVKPALAVVEREGRLVRPSGRVARDGDAARAIAADFAGPAIAQPVITGTGEGVFGLATDGGGRRLVRPPPRSDDESSWIGIERVPINPRRCGCTRSRRAFRSVGRLARDLHDRVASEWRARPYFMELNGRSWGSMALSCRRGYAFPAWAVQSRLDPAFRPAMPVNARHLTCRYLGGELIHLAFVMRGAGDKDSRLWPTRTQTVRDVLTFRRDEAWYNCRRGEPDVLAADTWQAVKAQLLRWRSR